MTLPPKPTPTTGITDWEIHADSEAQLITVLKSINAKLWRAAGTFKGRQIAAGAIATFKLANGTVIIINYYKTKYAPSGTRTVMGRTVPNMVPLPGVYASMRWLSPTRANPPQPPANSGVTLVPMPASGRQFA